MEKYIKYLVLTSLVILLGCGVYVFERYIVPMSVLVVLVFFVVGAFAIGEKIVGKSFRFRTY